LHFFIPRIGFFLRRSRLHRLMRSHGRTSYMLESLLMVPMTMRWTWRRYHLVGGVRARPPICIPYAIYCRVRVYLVIL
jgi:hypothetical protein